MTERRCDGCRWFWRYIREDVGQCRRYPPTQTIEVGWIEASPFDWCGEWSDKNITPEQHERRELMKQFAVAIAQGLCANPEDPSINVMRQAEAFVNDFYEAMQEEQR